MDKKKQIEEMARDFGNAQYRCNEDSPCCKECILGGDCIPYEYARVAYNVGYRKIPELPKDTVLTADDIAELLTIVARDTRKETARKFKKMLKELVADRNCNEDYDWEDVQVDGQIFVECVDEICKEIAEGKV